MLGQKYQIQTIQNPLQSSNYHKHITPPPSQYNPPPPMYNPTIHIYSGDYKYKPLDRYLLMRVGIPTAQPIKNAYKVQTNISPWAYIQRFTIFIWPNIICQSSVNPTIIRVVVLKVFVGMNSVQYMCQPPWH